MKTLTVGALLFSCFSFSISSGSFLAESVLAGSARGDSVKAAVETKKLPLQEAMSRVTWISEHAQRMSDCDSLSKFVQESFSGSVSEELFYADASSRCARRAMNLILDQRLLKLKNSAVTQFTAEMKLQKIFNESVRAACGAQLSKTLGQPEQVEQLNCERIFFTYRAYQAERLNAQVFGVEPPTTQIPANTKALKTKFRTFLSGLCALPPSVWERRTAPQDCEAKALKQLASAVTGWLSDEP